MDAPEKKVKILAFAGSTRKDSLNKKLVRAAARAAEEAGADVTVIDLKDYPMPHYDGDLEAQAGLPQKALELKKLMEESDGFLIATPDYNGSYPGVLKDAFDWASRKTNPGEASAAAFKGKCAAIMSSSPGKTGGLRALPPLRDLLNNLSVTVLPDMQAVPQGREAFDADGSLREKAVADKVAQLSKNLVETVKKLRP